MGIASTVDLLNGLNGLYPAVPKIPVQHADPPLRFERFLTHRPWSAAALPFFSFPLYPFMIGLGYLMPLDASTSIWFFYLFRKALLVLTDWLGALRGVGFTTVGPPYLLQQSYGAWFMLTTHSLWTSRRYLRAVACEVIRPSVFSAKEPFSYRDSFTLCLSGLAFLLWFSYRGGMSLWVGLIYFGVFLSWSLAIAKCRAELGPPAHEIVGLNSANFISHTIGMGRLSLREKVMMPLYWWFNGRGHRTHQMPIVLEGFKMAKATNLNGQGLVWLMVACMGWGRYCLFGRLYTKSIKSEVKATPLSDTTGDNSTS